MSFTWNTVPTTCTALQLTGFTHTRLKDKNETAQLKYAQILLRGLEAQGFKRDFALLFAIVTEEQMNNSNLEWFFTNLGFQLAFTGEKEDDRQRHEETGDLHMWTTTPAKYEEGLKSFKKTIEDRLNVIDRKRIDPERQKLPDMRLLDLKKAGLVFKNAYVDNPIYQILEAGVTPEAVAFFIRKNFGMDVTEIFGKDWTKVSGRQIKEAQAKWKNELVPY